MGAKNAKSHFKSIVLFLASNGFIGSLTYYLCRAGELCTFFFSGADRGSLLFYDTAFDFPIHVARDSAAKWRKAFASRKHVASMIPSESNGTDFCLIVYVENLDSK